MEATLTVNNEVKNASEKSLRAYNGLLTVDNPGGKTVSDAVKLAGGLAWAENLAKNGEMTDVFTIVREGTKKVGGKVCKVVTTGTGTRSALIERIKLALRADEWQITVKTVIEGKEESSDDNPADDTTVEAF